MSQVVLYVEAGGSWNPQGPRSSRLTFEKDLGTNRQKETQGLVALSTPCPECSQFVLQTLHHPCLDGGDEWGRDECGAGQPAQPGYVSAALNDEQLQMDNRQILKKKSSNLHRSQA